MSSVKNSFLYLGQPVTMPAYVPEETDWLRHGPFAQWLVYAARPRKIVEIGTDYGYSYFAFCEAIKASGIEADCIAIDTCVSNTDRIAAYGNALKRNEEYESFSTLLQGVSNECINSIPDASIDLLHFNGWHDYKDARECFERWSAKLSSRAIVLIHGTKDTICGSDKYSYWDKLRSKYETLNFPYQNGLGVLFYGTEYTDEIHELIARSQSEFNRMDAVSFFELAGDHFVLSEHCAAVRWTVDDWGVQAYAGNNHTPINKEVSSLASNAIGKIISRNYILDRLSSRSEEFEGGDIIQRRQHNAMSEALRRADYLLKKPITHRLKRELSRAILRFFPKINEAYRVKLSSSIDKRSYKDITSLVNLSDASFSDYTPVGMFNMAFSEKWKRKLCIEMAAIGVKQDTLVSVIMPTKNRRDIIHHAIRSVLAQSYKNFELIIVDDGSTDGTTDDIYLNFNDPRIVVLSSDGQGVCEARNTGLRHSSGEIVAYLDDDNRWHNDYLEISLMQMERADALTCYSVLARLEEGFGSSDDPSYLIKPFDLHSLKCSNFIDMNVFMHHRSLYDIYGGFDNSLKRMVDWDLIIRYCEKARPTICYSIGAYYDHSDRQDRITNTESISYQQVIRKKHLVDWVKLSAKSTVRSPELVSIIICVDKNPDIAARCLVSLVSHIAGANFEIILVDNGSNAETASLLSNWSDSDPRIRLIRNNENLKFSFGNNVGFSISRGDKVVFLNSNTEVTSEWLSNLIAPFDDPDIRGVQPKLLYPDGTIQSLGLIISDKAPFSYGLYDDRAGDDPLAARRWKFKALTATCLAMRANDFIAMKGFDGTFLNGQEDIDLCLRLGGGASVFACAADSAVIHYGSKTVGSSIAMHANRAAFVERWGGIITANDLYYHAADEVYAKGRDVDHM